MIAELPTPCLLLDRERLEANCARMRARARELGVALRPHFKTAKSVEVANVMLGDLSVRAGVVSTLEEAALFAPIVDDLTYAVGIVPSKLKLVAALQNEHRARIAVLTDDLDVARAIVAIAESLGARFDAWIEVDCGQGRGGRNADDPAVVAIARTLASSARVRLRGVLTHAGHSYGAEGLEAIARIAEDERRSASMAAEHIRSAGIACPEISLGSTPTALVAKSMVGATELRAGVYAFFDLFQEALGVCRREELAVSVLATVIARRDDAAWIDAGSLALSSDRSMDRFGGGYGELTDRPLRVDAINQVHGRIRGLDAPVGATVRVLPNHACITAAMFDRYHVVEGTEVIAQWPRLRG